MSIPRTHESSTSNVPLPGMEDHNSGAENKKPSDILGSLAMRAAAHIDPRQAKLFKTVRDPNATDQEIDQGHGWIRVPVEPPVANKQKPSTRAVESRYSDIGSDLAAPITKFDSSQELSTAESPTVPGLGHIAARHIGDAIEAINIMNSTGEDTTLGLALLRAHQEKPRN